MTAWLLVAALSAEPAFPERMPSMIEACLEQAVASGDVSKTDEDHKYICSGEVAQEMWDYLEDAKIEPWEQTTENGIWSSRGFPLGGCFKRIRNTDGSAATSGLSCTIWIPRRGKKKK